MIKKCLYIWLAWFCFLIAVGSIVAEIVRYRTGDVDPLRGIWVSSISSLCLAIWWTLLGGE